MVRVMMWAVGLAGWEPVGGIAFAIERGTADFAHLV